jgi:hypothetical protein
VHRYLTTLDHAVDRVRRRVEVVGRPVDVQPRTRCGERLENDRRNSAGQHEQSNLPTTCPQRDLSLKPRFDLFVKRRICRAFGEADARTRTGDPFITSEVLYQLSYVGRPPTLAA